MHITQQAIGRPQISEEKISSTLSIFTFSPLAPGFGHTLGNAGRRTLLSSVPGASITKVRVKGAAHEYTSLEGVEDSILNLILNLKKVSFKKATKEPELVILKTKGEGDVTAADLIFETDTEVINPDYVITSLDKKTSGLEIEIQLEKGIGFSSGKDRRDTASEGWILLDTIFSPIVSVQYEVTPTRVGDQTNLDTLSLKVETNGSITPTDSIEFSAQVLQGYFEFFQNNIEEKVEEEFLADFSEPDIISSAPDGDIESYTPIEILNLSPRTLNALINGNIGSVEEVLSSTPSQLESMRGFGKKAMSELTESLSSNGYEFNGED